MTPPNRARRQPTNRKEEIRQELDRAMEFEARLRATTREDRLRHLDDDLTGIVVADRSCHKPHA